MYDVGTILIVSSRTCSSYAIMTCQYVTNFKPAEFKQQLASLATARRLKIAKLQALQLVNDNPLASSTLRAEAQKAYNVCARFVLSACVCDSSCLRMSIVVCVCVSTHDIA